KRRKLSKALCLHTTRQLNSLVWIEPYLAFCKGNKTHTEGGYGAFCSGDGGNLTVTSDWQPSPVNIASRWPFPGSPKKSNTVRRRIRGGLPAGVAGQVNWSSSLA